MYLRPFWVTGFSLRSPSRIRISKYGGLNWLLHRAVAIVTVTACLPREGWRQNSKLWLSSYTYDYLKAVERPQTRCSEIFLLQCLWRRDAGSLLEGNTLHERPGMWALALESYAKTVDRELVIRGIHGQRKLGKEMKTENRDFIADEMKVAKERPS